MGTYKGPFSIQCKRGKVADIVNRVKNINGLEVTSTEPVPGPQIYKNGDRPYIVTCYANGAETSDVDRMYRGLKNKVNRFTKSHLKKKK